MKCPLPLFTKVCKESYRPQMLVSRSSLLTRRFRAVPYGLARVKSLSQNLLKILNIFCSLSFILAVKPLENERAVATIKIHDRADEFRIEIAGRFAGDVIDEVAAYWRTALQAASPRRFTVDISRLSGYDTPGCKLLAKMYRHGAQIAAATPLSLVFLNEISTPTRRHPALVRTMTPADVKRGGSSKADTKQSRTRQAAAGE